MKTAKIFTHGHSQAVRLPKEFRFNVDEVYIEKSGEGVILMPKKPDPWRNVRAVVGKFKGNLGVPVGGVVRSPPQTDG